MAEKIKLEVAITEDGELWGVYESGHIDLSLISHADVFSAIERDAEGFGLDLAGTEIDLDHVSGFKIEHMYLRQGFGGEDCHHNNDDCDCNFYWCNAGDAGAIPVTGVRFL